MPLSLDRSRLLRELIQIGIGLTSERDLALLPQRILTEARRFTHAEAGTLYLRDGDRLRFAVFQLINALDAHNQIVPFDPDYEELIRALASQATVAVRNAQLEAVARGRAALRFVASLATTMAHEINNPLSVIKGNIQPLVSE